MIARLTGRKKFYLSIESIGGTRNITRSRFSQFVQRFDAWFGFVAQWPDNGTELVELQEVSWWGERSKSARLTATIATYDVESWCFMVL